jgi:hypothetical protein
MLKGVASGKEGMAMERNDLEDMGPIDDLVVEFPGSRMTREGLPLLVDLVDRLSEEEFAAQKRLVLGS